MKRLYKFKREAICGKSGYISDLSIGNNRLAIYYKELDNYGKVRSLRVNSYSLDDPGKKLGIVEVDVSTIPYFTHAYVYALDDGCALQIYSYRHYMAGPLMLFFKDGCPPKRIEIERSVSNVLPNGTFAIDRYDGGKYAPKLLVCNVHEKRHRYEVDLSGHIRRPADDMLVVVESDDRLYAIVMYDDDLSYRVIVVQNGEVKGSYYDSINKVSRLRYFRLIRLPLGNGRVSVYSSLTRSSVLYSFDDRGAALTQSVIPEFMACYAIGEYILGFREDRDLKLCVTSGQTVVALDEFKHVSDVVVGGDKLAVISDRTDDVYVYKVCTSDLKCLSKRLILESLRSGFPGAAAGI